MQKHKSIWAVIFFTVFCLGLRTVDSWAQQDWKRTWEQVVAAANKEGRVVIAGHVGASYREALVSGFQKAYPGIRVEYIGLQSRDFIPRILRERKAGQYLWDINIGGPSSMIASLKRPGALAPLRKSLILPDVIDNTKWRGGFDEGFADNEGELIYMFSRRTSPIIYVNRDVIPPGQFDSPRELLNPRFAGRIAWDDPRVQGPGVNAAMLLMIGFGEEFLRRVFLEQNIVYTRNRRQLAEWVVKEQYPIVVGMSVIHLHAFQERGVGQNTLPLDDKASPVNNLSVGSGAVALIDKAPNPNAAKVYLNWLLSKDAQQAWNTLTGENSRRADVEPANPAEVPVPGSHVLRTPDERPKPGTINYLVTATEAVLPVREQTRKLAEQLIAK